MHYLVKYKYLSCVKKCLQAGINEYRSKKKARKDFSTYEKW